MALQFPYKRWKVPRPAVALGGSNERPRPVILATLVGPTRAVAHDALLDTGADDTVFPAFLAARLGLDLSQAPQGTTISLGGASCLIRFAPLTLRLTDGIEFREWPAWVGFTATPMQFPVLGFAGCLQFFT